MGIKFEVKYLVAIIISLILGGSILGFGYLDYRYKMEILKLETQSLIINSPTVFPSPTTVTTNKNVSTLKLLNQCLNSAQTERERVNGEILKFAEDPNNTGEYNLKEAFDSVERQYILDREVCFKKFPQN